MHVNEMPHFVFLKKPSEKKKLLIPFYIQCPAMDTGIKVDLILPVVSSCQSMVAYMRQFFY